MLEYRILGPLGISRDGVDLELGGRRQRALLALLLLSANKVVSTDTLIDGVWRSKHTQSESTALQGLISNLRKLLGADALVTSPPGYALRVREGELDLDRFELLLRRSRGEEPPARASMLDDALALWRGEPLADMRFEDFAQDPIRRLEDRKLVALHEHLEAENACGRHSDIVAEAKSLVAAHPTDEGFCHELVLALYRSGRQKDAMYAYHALLRALNEETGQPPGAKLKELYDRMLSHDVDRPEGGRSLQRVDRSAEIHVALRSARLVPVLGPRSRAGSAPTPDPAAVAAHLVRTFDCPSEASGSLARVAQHVAVTRGVGPLDDAVALLFAGAFAPGPVHRSLAALAPMLRRRGLPCQLILSSGYDCMLERAFAEAGEQVDVVSFIAHGRDRGKFLHITPDGPARVIHEPNLEIGLEPDQRTVILRLHGGAGEASGRDGDGFVVSEDDYIDYLSRSEPAAMLPIGLAKRLRRSHLLFMGYELDEWSLRVFLRRLWGGDGIVYRSWALDPTPNAVAHDYWRPLNVDLLDVAPHELLEKLCLRFEDAA